MDGRHFDSLTRVLAAVPTRRVLLGFLVTFPVLGGLLAPLGRGEADAKGRRRRRRARNARRRDPGSRKRPTNNKRKRKQSKDCTPEPTALTCAGKCGPVLNTCNEAVDCGVCGCNPEPLATTCSGRCGTVSNNCQAPVDCGACPCVPLSECPVEACGDVEDGCGGTLACGGCPACLGCVNNVCAVDASLDRSCCAGSEGERWCQAGECVPIPAETRATLAECGGRCDCQPFPGNACFGGTPASTSICGAARSCPLCEDCSEAPNHCGSMAFGSGPEGGSYYCLTSSTAVGPCVESMCPVPSENICRSDSCYEICFGIAD